MAPSEEARGQMPRAAAGRSAMRATLTPQLSAHWMSQTRSRSLATSAQVVTRPC